MGLCDILGITTPISWSMDRRLVDGKTERLIDLCRWRAPPVPLRPSAKAYPRAVSFRGESWHRAGVHGLPRDTVMHTQLFPPFEPPRQCHYRSDPQRRWRRWRSYLEPAAVKLFNLGDDAAATARRRVYARVPPPRHSAGRRRGHQRLRSDLCERRVARTTPCRSRCRSMRPTRACV